MGSEVHAAGAAASPEQAMPGLIGIKAAGHERRDLAGVWLPIAYAPYNADLQLAVFETDGPHALVFPCRRVPGGWINALNGDRIDIRPTHWRAWEEAAGEEAAPAGHNR